MLSKSLGHADLNRRTGRLVAALLLLGVLAC